jgi:hypothetical protein
MALKYCVALMEDACAVWRCCLPIVYSHYYALIAHAIEHYVAFEWMVIPVVM